MGDRRSANPRDGVRPKAGKYGFRAGVVLGLAQMRQVVATLVVRSAKRQDRLGVRRGWPGAVPGSSSLSGASYLCVRTEWVSHTPKKRQMVNVTKLASVQRCTRLDPNARHCPRPGSPRLMMLEADMMLGCSCLTEN